MALLEHRPPSVTHSPPFCFFGSLCPLAFPVVPEHSLYVVILQRNGKNSKSLIPFDNQSEYAGLYLETTPGPKMCQDLLTLPRARIPNLGLSTLGNSSNRREAWVILYNSLRFFYKPDFHRRRISFMSE